jgi:hypothetical protein
MIVQKGERRERVGKTSVAAVSEDLVALSEVVVSEDLMTLGEVAVVETWR